MSGKSFGHFECIPDFAHTKGQFTHSGVNQRHFEKFISLRFTENGSHENQQAMIAGPCGIRVFKGS